MITDRWITTEKDSEWAHAAVLDTLKTFPDLQSLSVELEGCQIEIPFHFFTTLRHISVHCVSDFANSQDYIQRNLLTRSLHDPF